MMRDNRKQENSRKASRGKRGQHQVSLYDAAAAELMTMTGRQEMHALWEGTDLS